MHDEIECAVKFLLQMLRSTEAITTEVREKFRLTLVEEMHELYDKHWYVDNPNRGSGYRCVRNVESNVDPLLKRVGQAVGLNYSELSNALPTEFALWVDPDMVSYRIGEEGSIGCLPHSNRIANSLSAPSSDDSGLEDPDSDTPSTSPVPCSFNNRHLHSRRHHMNQQQMVMQGVVDGAPQPCSSEARMNIYYSGRERHYYPEVM